MESLFSVHNSRDDHFQYIFNLLQIFKGSVKFYDIRNQSSFQYRHIQVAVQVFPDTLTVDLNTIGHVLHEKEVPRLRRFCIIIAYDHLHKKTAKQILNVLKELKCKEVHMLDHIEEFIECYNFLCSSVRNLAIHSYPNEILPKFLYLGTQEHAHCYDVITSLQITHIVNVTKSAPNIFPGIKYCRVHVEDRENEKISLFFKKAYEFIEEALDEKEKGTNNVVLVHCAQGVSRSSTIVIMFLMRASGLSLEEAIKFVKKHRSIIEPNEGFLTELQEFQIAQKQFHRRKSAVWRKKFESENKFGNNKRTFNIPRISSEVIKRKKVIQERSHLNIKAH